jgi:hypothetical protein
MDPVHTKDEEYVLMILLYVPGMYRTCVSVRKVYIGQSGRTVVARCKHRQRYARLHQPEKSAVAEHNISTVHCIDFSGTSIIYGTP